jgi:hypothetical protein
MTKASRRYRSIEPVLVEPSGWENPDWIFESIAIPGGISGSRAWPIDAQHVAQFRGEQLEVGALGRTGLRPARDEDLDWIQAVRFGLA